MTMVNTTTDENGQFVIPNVSLDDRISVTIDKRGYALYEADLDLSEVVNGNLSISLQAEEEVGGGENYLTLTLKTLYNNTPIANVNVGLFEQGNMNNQLIEGVTDSNGECTLEYESGTYTIACGNNDYQIEQPMDITLDSNKTINVTLIEREQMITDPQT